MVVIFFFLLFNASIGGADTRYTYVGGYDYRNASMKSGVAFQLQGVHSTMVHHYNDTLDFLVISKNPKMTTVQVYCVHVVQLVPCWLIIRIIIVY